MKKLLALRHRRYMRTIDKTEVASVLGLYDDYDDYESERYYLGNFLSVLEAANYYRVSMDFWANETDRNIAFTIPRIRKFFKNKNNEWAPLIDDAGYSADEPFEFPYLICNLVCYNGYHLLLSGRNYKDFPSDSLAPSKSFNPSSAHSFMMGLAYFDDEGNFLPFLYSKQKGNFAGICIDDWNEFKKDIWLRDSKYRKFLDLLTDDDEAIIENNIWKHSPEYWNAQNGIANIKEED